MRRFLVVLLLVACPAFAGPKMLCTVGDSLVAGGPILSGNPSWTALLQTERSTGMFGTVNIGVGGYTAAQALSLFNTQLKGHGCTHVAVLVGTNDLAASTSAATVFATIQSIASSAREDTSGSQNGINVTVLTVPPRGGSASWDATKETQRLALRTLILAMSADAVVDLESMAGTGSPVEMAAAYRAADMLHFNGTVTTGGSEKVKQLVSAAVAW